MFVLKCSLGHFQCFEKLFFLVENRPIRNPPPLLVENSATFFFETFPKAHNLGYFPKEEVILWGLTWEEYSFPIIEGEHLLDLNEGMDGRLVSR